MKKIKEFSKKYLIGFFIGLILFTVVGVYATTYFPSNQTTYDNKTSGLNATNVQTAIDELYNTCFPPTLGDQILENTELEKDPYECRYFFTGANPNNYIRFNNETWRIVSVECDGTIKIMGTIGSQFISWDSYNNNWARPASLNTYLNGTYLTSTLNSTAQSQIVAKDWSVGGITTSNITLENQITSENSSKWNGKVALVTISEFIRSNDNKSDCGVMYMYNNNYESCKNTTWMFNTGNWWTLSIGADGMAVHYIRRDGYVEIGYANDTYYVWPSVYLSSDIKITGGNGSSSNPYQIEIS